MGQGVGQVTQGPEGLYDICEVFHDKGLFRSEGRKLFRDKLVSGGLGP